MMENLVGYSHFAQASQNKKLINKLSTGYQQAGV